MIWEMLGPPHSEHPWFSVRLPSAHSRNPIASMRTYQHGGRGIISRCVGVKRQGEVSVKMPHHIGGTLAPLREVSPARKKRERAPAHVRTVPDVTPAGLRRHSCVKARTAGKTAAEQHHAMASRCVWLSLPISWSRYISTDPAIVGPYSAFRRSILPF